MNATKAKQLRKLAMSITNTSELVKQTGIEALTPMYQNFQGLFLKVRKGVPFQLAPDCSNKVYKNLKHDYKLFKRSNDQHNYNTLQTQLA